MNNIIRVLTPRTSPNEIQRIRAAVPILHRFSDLEIEKLWEAFSDNVCAGWLIVNDETLGQFKEWASE